MRSGFDRKNPVGVIHAFRTAFKEKDECESIKLWADPCLQDAAEQHLHRSAR
jgi:hypothetical protein